MKIIRSSVREKWAFEKMKTWLTRRPRSTDAWHVSDLIYPRKAYFQRTDPRGITNEQSLYFIAGHGHHHIVESILGPKKVHDRTDAGEFLKMGIYFSPDMKEEVMGYPIEIKTSRARKTPEVSGTHPKKAFESYLKQLCSYMALMDKKIGYLLVLYLAAQVGKWQFKPLLRFYKVKMTPAERKEKLDEIQATAASLTAAVKKKSAKALPLCPQWLCQDCQWFKECAPNKIDPKRKQRVPDDEE